MQVSVEAKEGLERHLTITVPADKINQAVDKKVNETAKTIRLDGFRKGKVPTQVVKKRFGASIRQEVIGDVIQSSYFEALKDNDINPAGMPEIEPAKNNTDTGEFTYTAVVEVYPEIALPDASKVSLERMCSEVQDSDIDKMIDSVRKQQATWTEVERASADGDQVVIDFVGSLDGENFDGGSSENHELILGSNSMIPGFEDGILGMSKGETKDISVTFPADYQAEHLAGKEASFNIKLHTVKQPELPELNAEFYAKFNPKEADKKGFEAEIRTNMERELNRALKQKLKNDVLNAYVDLAEFDIPKALIQNEIKRKKEQALKQFGGDNSIDLSQIPDDLFAEPAQKHVKLSLLTTKYIEANELKPEEDKMRSILQEMAQGYESPDEFIDYYMQNEEQRGQIENLTLEEMVVENLMAAGQVTDVEVEYEKAMQSLQAKS